MKNGEGERKCKVLDRAARRPYTCTRAGLHTRNPTKLQRFIQVSLDYYTFHTRSIKKKGKSYTFIHLSRSKHEEKINKKKGPQIQPLLARSGQKIQRTRSRKNEEKEGSWIRPRT